MFTQYKIIQGGMGVGTSGWQLARAVSCAGGIGTVSGTAVAQLLVDTLQKGDPGGHFTRALSHFPFPEISAMVLEHYFVYGGVLNGKSVRTAPMPNLTPSKLFIATTVCANFAFVWLAKEGHQGLVFVNYLEKIQIPHIYSIFGAMLAHVDGIAMGAGIPKEIPGVIDSIIEEGEVSYPLYVEGAPINAYRVKWNPQEFFQGTFSEFTRPAFFPIVSSHVLAQHLLKSNQGKIDGFIVEAPTAGGHNAPPRGKLELNGYGEPLYGPRDEVDWQKMKELGVPFWIAGSVASPEGLETALSLGASGIQAGSIFALSNESGLREDLKRRIRFEGYFKKLRVFTSPIASPAGFPFKVLPLEGTLSQESVYDKRGRNCSLGYLRIPALVDGKIVYRCSAEPEKDYVRKGGKLEETAGRVCLCNALCSAIGARIGEPPIITSGDDLSFLFILMENENGSYGVEDVMDYLRL